MVAVAADLELPPQQSEILGHLASSQTVCRFSPRRSFLMRLKLSLEGIGVLSHEGSRVIVFFLPGGPTWAVRSSRASAGVNGSSFAPAKSPNAGPVFNRSVNVLAGRGRAEVVFGGGGSLTVVANGRRCRHEG